MRGARASSPFFGRLCIQKQKHMERGICCACACTCVMQTPDRNSICKDCQATTSAWTGCQICPCAAYNGHLSCLKNAREHHHLPWGEHTCAYAAQNGHLDCLKYAHEHGCAWDAGALDCAAIGRHIDCVRYMVLHGCPLHALLDDEMKRARAWIRWYRIACAVRVVRILGRAVERRRRLRALWTGEVLRELREAPAGGYSGRMAPFPGGVDWCAARDRYEKKRSRKRKREDVH